MDFIAGLHLFISIFAVLHSVRCQDTYLKRECVDARTCYTLYQAPVTWDQAASYCQSINQRLAVIPDQDTQDVISRFAGSGTGDDQLAWVGGRRSSDTRWRDVNGAVIPIQGMITVLVGGPRWCSAVKLAVGSDDGLFAFPCQDNLQALCQVASASDAPGAVLYNISKVWHVVTDARFVSWESARSHCETTYRTGRLAFSVVSRGRVFAADYPDDSYFWVGFYRRPWTWLGPAGLFTYRNWLPMGGVSALGECMGVDLRQNSGWRDAVCEDTNNYVLCDGDLATSTPIHTTDIPTSSEVNTKSVSTLTSSASPVPLLTDLPTTSEEEKKSITTVTTGGPTAGTVIDNVSMPCASCVTEIKVLQGILGLFVALTCVATSVAIILGIQMRSLKTKPTEVDPCTHDYYNMGPASVNVTQATPSETRSDISGDYLTTANRDTRIHTPGDVLDYESTEDPDRPYGSLDGNMRDPPEISSPTYASLQ